MAGPDAKQLAIESPVLLGLYAYWDGKRAGDAAEAKWVKTFATYKAKHPELAAELARRVASPGGVTQVGLDVLDDGDRLASLLHECLRQARDRSAAMAREARLTA